MSNYHYDDRSSCSSCVTNTVYSSLKETNNHGCGPKCMMRFNDERSVKDKMYYQHFVLNKPLRLNPINESNTWKKTQNMNLRTK